MSLQDLKDAMKTQKLVFGARQAIKNLKNGKTKVIFLANNCGEDIQESIDHYAKL
ncbi:50S ribosomal protein L30e, partial [Candidatus Woesearchaeota archaeon]|nr:50S ribosomal protein L30e [Candidatus Woesearchaeota archaeon]